MEGKKILVVEDDLTWLELLSLVLDKNGLEYDAFVRVYEDGDGYEFMDIGGKRHKLELSTYWVALVDGKLKTSVPQGIDLARKLPKKGLPVVAMSGSKYLNDDMVGVGALIGFPKDQLFGKLSSQQLNLAEIVAVTRKAS